MAKGNSSSGRAFDPRQLVDTRAVVKVGPTAFPLTLTSQLDGVLQTLRDVDVVLNTIEGRLGIPSSPSPDGPSAALVVPVGALAHDIDVQTAQLLGRLGAVVEAL